jgi:hypothetical protein
MTDLIELSETERLFREERQTFVDTVFRPPLVSIIIPTLNERDNVHEIVSRLDRTLSGQTWEVVFVAYVSCTA